MNTKNTGSPGDTVRLDKKGLELILERIPELQNPKPNLEQHTTPSWIAAELLWNIRMKGLLTEKLVIDLGSGTGRLCLGSLLMGAKECVSIEIDQEQIGIQKQVMEELGLDERTHLIRGDATSTPLRELNSSLTIMNPPFGTVRKGIDTRFLLEAMQVSPHIFSFHLSNNKTRIYLEKKAGEKHYNLTILNTYYMELKQVFDYHKSRIKRVPVDLIYYRKRGDKDEREQ